MTVRSTDKSTSSRISAARRGEPWAWDELYSELSGPVAGYLRSRGAAEFEDLTAEVFLQVARDISRFSGDEEQFRSWVFVIAHRRLIDARRYGARRPVTGQLGPHELETQGGDVEQEGIDALALAEVRAVLDTLTEEQRDVVTLRVIGDLSLEETAEVMGKRVGAVKALQRRALMNLKSQLQDGESQ